MKLFYFLMLMLFVLFIPGLAAAATGAPTDAAVMDAISDLLAQYGIPASVGAIILAVLQYVWSLFKMKPTTDDETDTDQV